MKKLSTIVAVAALAVGSLVVKNAFTFSSGPIDGVTGAPGEGNCTQCHSGTANSGPATLTIGLDGGQPLTEYVPGQTYSLVVAFGNDTRPRHGFELTAITSRNVQGGTLVVEDMVRTQLSESGGRQYLKHTTAGNQSDSWNFKWTAPAAGAGAITFYAAGNSANGNGQNTGDQIYTTSFTLAEGVAVAVKPAAIEGGTLTAFPNPAAGSTTVSFSLKHGAEASVALYDLQGHKVMQQDLGFLSAGKHSQRITIPADAASGTYILRLEANHKASAIRMNILKV